jgi:hypothetical protein
MNGITVTLDLDALIVGFRHVDDEGDGVGAVTFVEAVVEEVAHMVLSSIKNDVTTKSLYPTLRERAVAIRNEEIRAAIKPAIEQAITATLQPTDHYGNPKGESKTTHELIVEHATKVLTAKDSDHYSRTKGLNLVEQFIATEVKAALEQAKADVLRAVKDQGAKVLSETIAKMAGIR